MLLLIAVTLTCAFVLPAWSVRVLPTVYPEPPSIILTAVTWPLPLTVTSAVAPWPEPPVRWILYKVPADPYPVPAAVTLSDVIVFKLCSTFVKIVTIPALLDPSANVTAWPILFPTIKLFVNSLVTLFLRSLVTTLPIGSFNAKLAACSGSIVKLSASNCG